MSTALQGVRVLDLSRVLAGPWAGMTLGDLGAEVIKIEQPGVGDESRGWAPPSLNGVSTYYLGANRNKKSVAIDIGAPQGRALITALARQCDVLIENFRPATLRKFGLTYEDLQAINPRLIVCSISGYGRGHAFEDRPGYDFVIQAESGWMSITGEADGAPMKLGVAFVDLVSGMNAVQAILAALLMRERTGRGQWLDISLTDSALFLLANVASGVLNTGVDAKRYGNAHASIVPYQLFECADRPVAVAVGNDEQFRRFCDVIGMRGLLEDGRFATNQGRNEHRDALLPVLEARLRTLKQSDVLRGLRDAGVPAGAVRSVREALHDELAELRGTVVTADSPTLGAVRSVRNPLRMSDSPFAPPAPPPGLGEHTADVLREMLGLSAEQIEGLREAGVIGAAGANRERN